MENRKKYPDEQMLAIPKKEVSGESITLSNRDLKKLHKKKPIANLALKSGAEEDFFYTKDKPGEATPGDALEQLENDHERDVKINDNEKEFFAGVESIELTLKELQDLGKKCNKLTPKDLEELKRGHTNPTQEELEELKKNYINNKLAAAILKAQKIKKLQQVFGDDAYGLYHAYSQGPAQLILRTLEDAIAPSIRGQQSLFIKNPPKESRDINIIEENGKVYLTIKLKNIPIMDDESQIQGFFNPSENTFRFELKQKHGQWGFEFEKLETADEDLLKIFRGERLPEQTIREKYCPPHVTFNIARSKLINFVNDESKNSSLQKVAEKLLDLITKDFIENKLFPLAQQPDLIKEFTDLFNVLRSAIKEPAGADAFYLQINRILRNIEEISTDKASKVRPLDILTKVGEQLKLSHHHLRAFLTEFMDLIPEAAISTLETRLATNKEKETKSLRNKIKNLKNTQTDPYIAAIKARAVVDIEIVRKTPGHFEDPDTATFSGPKSSIGTYDIESDSLRKSEQAQIVRMRNRDWLAISTNPSMDENPFFTDATSKDVNQAILFNGYLYDASGTFNLWLESKISIRNFAGKSLFNHLQDSYNKGIKSLPIDANPNLQSRVTANVFEDLHGNIYLDVIHSDFTMKEVSSDKTNNIPGMIVTRYILTDDGFKLESITCTNNLLKEMMLNKAPNMIDYAKRIPIAEQDELNNFKRAIATSNEYVRRAWGSIASIYKSIEKVLPEKSSDLKFTKSDYTHLQQLSTQIIADPFNQTLLSHYHSALSKAIKATQSEEGNTQDDTEAENKVYREMQKAMDIFIQEAQLQAENNLIAKILKTTESLLFNSPPTLQNVQEYLSLMEKVRYIPNEIGQEISNEMFNLVTGNEKLLSLCSLANLKTALQKLPSEYSSTVTSHLTKEANYSLFMNNKEPFFAKLPVPVPSGALATLINSYPSSFKKDFSTWKEAAILIAMDDLFDENGAVRKDIATIFEVAKKHINFELEDNKQALLKSYIEHFIVGPLNKKLEREQSEQPDAKNKIASLSEELMDVNFTTMPRETLQEDLLINSEITVKNKSLRDFIYEYSYSRNRYALQKTVSAIKDPSEQENSLTIKKQATAILTETDDLKRKGSSIGIPNLARTLSTVNKAIKDPTEENVNGCFELGNKIQRSGESILGGMLLTVGGVFLLTGAVLLWPVTQLISEDLAIESLDASYAVITIGLKMAGFKDQAKHSPKTNEPNKKPGFFNRVHYDPIKSNLDKLGEILTPKKQQ